MTHQPAILACALAAVLTAVVQARNVDLSTVPRRDTVQLTIYNSEDLTLVREMRTLTFKQGLNGLQFSWANTLIDPSSVEIRFLSRADKLSLLDTTYPHDKPQMLSWNVISEFDGDAAVEITYFTSGITWSADYLLTSDPEEKTLGFEGFVRVTNNSGEDYEGAQVRLVVGTINLVEKIAQLARIGMDDVSGMKEAEYKGYRQRATRKMVGDWDEKREAGAVDSELADAPADELRAKTIIKEGLSEYFIFRIPGAETIPNGWSKRLRAIEAERVPFKIQYRYRPAQYGDQLVRMYLFTNDVPSKLGSAPLPDGVIRVFRLNGRDGLSYLAQQPTKYIPIGDKVEVNLGPDPEVIFELIKLRASRDNIWMRVHGADVFRRVDDGAVNIEVNSSVAGWDDREVFTQRIRNYTAKPIEVEVRRAFTGHVDFRSSLPGVKLFDFQTVEFTAPVAAGKKADCLFEILRHQARNSKQNNITLVNAEIFIP
ncbi:MAG: DUF4139 domain-containing protein [Lentisphaerae bacterium]|nr:DUF4139 domain-containing protein [Lentisphaerota bacterium]